MAELTPQQIRTLNAPALPPAPTTAILEVQQTERTAGTQSSGISLAEVKAAPGAIVETAVAYETAATDTTVNVNASDIPITIGDSMWVGSRLLIRRTAAYDGNPVTISPPSGATFEGLASLSLYGQYSFVELERISETVFAIRDIQDTPPLDVEQVTNEKWVDGKRIYQKIVDFGALPDTTKKTIAHGITGLDTFVHISGVSATFAKATIPLPVTCLTSTITLYATTVNVGIETTSDRTSNITTYILLKYTKT
jgi:hypothetical protein